MPGFVHVMHDVLDAAAHGCPSFAFVGHAGIDPPPQSQVNSAPALEQSVYWEQRWPPVPVGAPDELLLHANRMKRAAAAAKRIAMNEA